MNLQYEAERDACLQQAVYLGKIASFDYYYSTNEFINFGILGVSDILCRKIRIKRIVNPAKRYSSYQPVPAILLMNVLSDSCYDSLSGRNAGVPY